MFKISKSIILSNSDYSKIFFGKMPRYPFNGRSKYLIDKFYIIGYDYLTLKKILIEKQLHFIDNKQIKENQNNKYPIEFEIEEPPYLLNELTNDYSKKVLDINMIIEMIFPNPPKFYYKEGVNQVNNLDKKTSKFEEKNSIENEFFPVSYNVVFSSNPQAENNSKKSINGFAHIFYKKFIEKKITQKYIYTFYIPIVFCIISEFPYYNSFYKLLRQIMLSFKPKCQDIPIELIIQNILNFTLSPINNDVILNISPIKLNILNNSLSRKNAMIKIKKILDESSNKDEFENKISENEFQYKKNERKNSEKKNIKLKQNMDIRITMREEMHHKAQSPFGKKELEKKKTINDLKLKNSNIIITEKNEIIQNEIPENISSIFTQKEEDETINFEPIEFSMLSGYPLIQYNLAKVLLNNFSVSDVITIFLYTFLEKDVIFFSENIELLSLTLDCYNNLNFPLNDEKYYFINACVSYDNYVKNNSPFVGSTFTTMLGINSEFNPNYINSSHKLNEHLVIDIDNGFVKIVNDDKKTNNQNEMFFDLIKKICKNKYINEEDEKILFLREIKVLDNNLSKCKEKIMSIKNNNFYIDYDHQLDLLNRKIQEDFYRFVLNICVYLYENIIINIGAKNVGNKNTTKPELQFGKWEIKSNNNYTKEEIFLINELKDTMKFESFIYGFIQSYNPIDLFKIPLSFTEEFLSILSRKKIINQTNIKYFSLFDKLYENDSKGRIDIDFVPFKTKYYEKYKKYFDRDVIDSLNDKYEIVNFNYQKEFIYNYKYKWYELDNNIILKYLLLLNNFDKEENKNLFYFPLYNLEKNQIKEIFLSEIENQVEELALNTNFINNDDICCCNIILLFTLSLKSLCKELETSSFLSYILSEFNVFRKYITIMLHMAFKLFEDCYGEKDFIGARNLLYCYYQSINIIKDKYIPNEKLLKEIYKFNNINVQYLFEKIKASKNKDNENQTKNNNTKAYKDVLSGYKKTITRRRLFICHNFNKNGIIPEKKIIEDINNNNKSIFDLEENEKNVKPKIKFYYEKNYIDYEVNSQIFILRKIYQEFDSFLKAYDINKINSKVILGATMNIILYIRNSNVIINSVEVLDILKKIFNIFYDIYEKNDRGI